MNIKLKKTNLFPQKLLLFLIILLFLPLLVQAEWKTFGSVTQIAETKKNGVILETSSKAKVEISFFDQTSVRVRIAPNGTFERDFSYAFDYSVDRKVPDVKVLELNDEIVLTNYFGAKVSIKKTPLLVTIYNVGGE
ncbi:MAG: hypothetical protein ABI686_14255, partial [Acidobacteriota bacterium]